MKDKQYYTISSILFAVIAIVHLGRIIMGMEATINGNEIPYWFSGAAVILTGYLATRGFAAAHRLG